MKEILTKEMVNLLDLIKKSGAFALDQLPKVCEEMVKYEVYSSLISALICASIAYACIKVYIANIEKSDGNIYTVYCAFSAFVCLAYSIVFIIHVSNLMKPLFAPRLFIIEEISRLIK